MKKFFTAFITMTLFFTFQLSNQSVVNNDEFQSMVTLKTVQAQGANVWFYSGNGIDHWLTKVQNEGNNIYTASVTTTSNGQFHQIYLYRVTSENGIAYTSTYDRMSGKWESWYHNDYAQALWRAIQENF